MQNFKNLVGYHNSVTEENLPLLGANENLESQSGNFLVVFIFFKADREEWFCSLKCLFSNHSPQYEQLQGKCFKKCIIPIFSIHKICSFIIV